MNLFGGNKDQGQNQEQKPGGGGGLMGKLNNTLGGGQAGEQKEGMSTLIPPKELPNNVGLDHLDKGVDWVQQNVMGQGPQDNESAMEQAKDEQISGFIKRGYKGATGKDMPFTDSK